MRTLLFCSACIAAGLLVSPAAADLMPSVDNGSGDTVLSGLAGTTVGGRIDAINSLPDVVGYQMVMALEPFAANSGGGSPAEFNSFAYDPTYWNDGANAVNAVASPALAAALTRFDIGIPGSGGGGSPVSGNGTVMTFDVSIPADAAAGDRWHVLFIPPPAGESFYSTDNGANPEFDFSGLPAGPTLNINGNMIPTIIGGKVNAIPEPSAFLLLFGLATGAFGVRVVMRRRGKQ